MHDDYLSSLSPCALCPRSPSAVCRRARHSHGRPSLMRQICPQGNSRAGQHVNRPTRWHVPPRVCAAPCCTPPLRISEVLRSSEHAR